MPFQSKLFEMCDRVLVEFEDIQPADIWALWTKCLIKEAEIHPNMPIEERKYRAEREVSQTIWPTEEFPEYPARRARRPEPAYVSCKPLIQQAAMDRTQGELTVEQFEWVWQKIVEQRGIDPNEYSKYLVDRKAWDYWRLDDTGKPFPGVVVPRPESYFPFLTRLETPWPEDGSDPFDYSHSPKKVDKRKKGGVVKPAARVVPRPPVSIAPRVPAPELSRFAAPSLTNQQGPSSSAQVARASFTAPGEESREIISLDRRDHQLRGSGNLLVSSHQDPLEFSQRQGAYSRKRTRDDMAGGTLTDPTDMDTRRRGHKRVKNITAGKHDTGELQVSTHNQSNYPGFNVELNDFEREVMEYLSTGQYPGASNMTPGSLRGGFSTAEMSQPPLNPVQDLAKSPRFSRIARTTSSSLTLPGPVRSSALPPNAMQHSSFSTNSMGTNRDLEGMGEPPEEFEEDVARRKHAERRGDWLKSLSKTNRTRGSK